MKISEIKKKMIAYRDMFGGDLIASEDIKGAKTKEELNEIFIKHASHLEDCANDAICSMEEFKKTLFK